MKLSGLRFRKLAAAVSEEEIRIAAPQNPMSFRQGLRSQRSRPLSFLASEEEWVDAPSTPRQRRQVAERTGILARFADLRARGIPGRQAARMLGVSHVSIWRYRQRVVPLTWRCGRRAKFPLAQIPPWIFGKVMQLQASGASNSSAWRAVGKFANCPADLARLLESARTIPANFLRATRLSSKHAEIWTPLTVLEGPNFVRLLAGQSSVRTRKSKSYEGNESAKPPRAEKGPSGR
jgi:hypothetical protein